MIRKLIVLLAVVALGGSAAKATMVVTIYPEDAKGIRDFHNGEGPFLLSSLMIDKGTENRSVLEFDVSGLSGKQQPVTLNLWLDNIDEGSPEGIIDVFTFVGDGVVTADDFYAGGLTPFISFIGEDYFCRVTIDVTSVIQDILTADEEFIGFRLSTETTDRFNMGRVCRLPDPVLTVVPEPASVLLLALGGLALIRRRQ